jgi:hypothetical protein
MNRCFVIQPFDKGPFDKRFDDIIEPAIGDAGLAAYRVDRDPGVTVPIDDIERGIHESAAVIADISLDNPNIWYEVGYARAADKPLVMICSSRRDRFPFDIQHRSIIKYSTDSVSDFTKLRDEIAERLRAVVGKNQEVVDNEIRKSRLLELASNILRTPGYDISVLEEVLQSIRDESNVHSDAIGRRRFITSATIHGVVVRSMDSGLIERKNDAFTLTQQGQEMLNYLSSYLRPRNLH